MEGIADDLTTLYGYSDGTGGLPAGLLTSITDPEGNVALVGCLYDAASHRPKLRNSWASRGRNWSPAGYCESRFQMSRIVASSPKPVGQSGPGLLAQYQVLPSTGTASVRLPGICR